MKFETFFTMKFFNNVFSEFFFTIKMFNNVFVCAMFLQFYFKQYKKKLTIQFNNEFALLKKFIVQKFHCKKMYTLLWDRIFNTNTFTLKF